MSNLEKEIIDTTKAILINSVKELSKSSYNNPVYKIVEKVVENNQAKLYEYIYKAFEEAWENQDFKKLIKDEISRKLVRGILTSSEGDVDSTISKLKQNAVFKAKLTVAVDDVLNDFVKDK